MATTAHATITAALGHCLSRLVADGATPLPRQLRYHGLSGVVAAAAESGALAGLNALHLQAIRADAIAFAAQAMAWQEEWRRLLDSLPEEIPVLVLKGAALAHTHYPRAHWRMLGDIDLLIEARDRPRFEDGLRQAGYTPTLSSGGDLLFSEQQYVRQLSATLESRVDLHWALSNRPALGAWSGWPELWSGSVSVGPLQARGLGTTDALLQACVHRTGHHRLDGDRLIWLLDIHLLWTTPGASGQAAAIARARTTGLCALLLDALDATAAWFNTEVAAIQRERLQIAARGEPCARLLTGQPAAWQDSITLPRWRQRFKYLGQLLFPPRAYMERRYGRRGPLAWLYLSRCWDGLRKSLPR